MRAAGGASEGRVWVVLSDQGGAYAEVADALRDELGREARLTDWVVGPWQKFATKSLPPPQLIVAIGARAFAAMVEKTQAEPGLSKVPVLATLLPRASYLALAPKVPGATSAVWLDQPVERYLALVRLAMPERQRVGVLFGPDSEAFKAPLLKAAAAQGQTVSHATLFAQGDEVYPALREVLSQAQVLLALPDNLVFNPTSLQNILITAYRQRIPMVTYAAAHARAGATLALYATPVQVASQAAAAVRAFLAGRGLPSPRFADQFTVTVNAQVGRSLGLATVEPEVLAQMLRQTEESR